MSSSISVKRRISLVRELARKLKRKLGTIIFAWYVVVHFQGKQPVSDITRALILSVSVCYHARLQERDEYENGVVQQFTAPLTITGKEQFCNEIKW